MIVALILAVVVWWTFVGYYAIRSKWWRNPYGRNVMALGVGLAVLLTMCLFISLGHALPDIALSAVFLVIAGVGIQRIYRMEKAQRNGA